MSLLIAAAALLIPLVGGLALGAWLQITRDVIVDETDDEESDSGGGPRMARTLDGPLWAGRHRGLDRHHSG